MAGPATELAAMWDRIKSDCASSGPVGPEGTSPGLTIGKIEENAHFLGCTHHVLEKTSPITGKMVRAMEWDMETFFKSCVDKYKELTGISKLKEAKTPFIDETKDIPYVDELLPNKTIVPPPKKKKAA